MVARRVLFLSSCLALTALVVNAANLTSTNCVDESGFKQCQDKANSVAKSCLDDADKNGSRLATLACGCDFYIDNYNCYASHCWNRVYECEYQKYIIEYLRNCPTGKLPVPYFPAPDDAEGSCSCNLGKLYVAVTGSIDQGSSCINNQKDFNDATENLQKIEGCKCCEISAARSSFYDICPDTNPDDIDFSQVSLLETTLQDNLDSCGPYLSKYDCKSDLSFSVSAINTIYMPGEYPANGTATLSNGPGTVTTPGRGDSFTYTNEGNSQIYTISAAHGSDRSDSKASGATETKASSSAKNTGGSDATDTGDKHGAASRETAAGYGKFLLPLAIGVLSLQM